jgi:predicted nucleotidyltransferase
VQAGVGGGFAPAAYCERYAAQHGLNDGDLMTTISVVRKCKAALESHYCSRFKGLVLYGFVARNQADSSSDIDLLVLLSKPFDYFSELRQVIEVLYPIQLESEQLISAKPVPTDEFEHGSIQLYRNAKREGILV